MCVGVVDVQTGARVLVQWMQLPVDIAKFGLITIRGLNGHWQRTVNFLASDPGDAPDMWLSFFFSSRGVWDDP